MLTMERGRVPTRGRTSCGRHPAEASSDSLSSADSEGERRGDAVQGRSQKRNLDRGGSGPRPLKRANSASELEIFGSICRVDSNNSLLGGGGGGDDLRDSLASSTNTGLRDSISSSTGWDMEETPMMIFPPSPVAKSRSAKSKRSSQRSPASTSKKWAPALSSVLASPVLGCSAPPADPEPQPAVKRQKPKGFFSAAAAAPKPKPTTTTRTTSGARPREEMLAQLTTYNSFSDLGAFVEGDESSPDEEASPVPEDDSGNGDGDDESAPAAAAAAVAAAVAVAAATTTTSSPLRSPPMGLRSPLRIETSPPTLIARSLRSPRKRNNSAESPGVKAHDPATFFRELHKVPRVTDTIEFGGFSPHAR